MKRIVTIVLIAVFSISLSAQELDSLKAIMEKNDEPGTKQTGEKESSYPVIVEDNGDEVNVKVMDKEIFKVTESGDSTYVRIGEKGMLQVIDQPDSTTIRVGDKEIRIVEKNDDTAIRIQDIDDDDNFVTKRFRGHWAGFEWGINNFLDNANTLSRERVFALSRKLFIPHSKPAQCPRTRLVTKLSSSSSITWMRIAVS